MNGALGPRLRVRDPGHRAVDVDAHAVPIVSPPGGATPPQLGGITPPKVGGHPVKLAFRAWTAARGRTGELDVARGGRGGAPRGPAVVFDIDGVLSDAAGRQHFLERGQRDWASFFEACGDDPVIEEIARLLELLDSFMCHDVAGVNSAARWPSGPARGQLPVDHGTGEQVQRHDDEAQTDGQQADGGVAVDGGRELHPLHPDQPLRRPSSTWGQSGSGWWCTRPATSTAMKPPRVASSPPTARMANAVTTVADSVWARNSSLLDDQ